MIQSEIQSEFRYLPARPRDLQWGLHVSGAGRAVIRPGSAYPPAGHPDLYHFTWSRGRSLPEYQVVFIAAGAGLFESDPSGPQPIGAGTAIILFPGVWHRYRPDRASGWEEYWVGFSGEQMDRLVYNRFFSPERPLLRTGIDQAVIGQFQGLLARLREPTAGLPHLAATDVLAILALVLAATREETHHLILQGPRDVEALTDRLVSESLRLIWSGSHLDLSVADLARRLHTTPRSLERRFHQALGRTVREEILRCRLDRVKRLLADTDLSVAQIVSASGFSSPDAMARAIQRESGTTPLKLRARLRAERGRHRPTSTA